MADKVMQITLSEELYKEITETNLRQQCNTDSEFMRAAARRVIESEKAE